MADFGSRLSYLQWPVVWRESSDALRVQAAGVRNLIVGFLPHAWQADHRRLMEVDRYVSQSKHAGASHCPVLHSGGAIQGFAN